MPHLRLQIESIDCNIVMIGLACQMDEEGQVAKIRHGETLDDHIRFFDGL